MIDSSLKLEFEQYKTDVNEAANWAINRINTLIDQRNVLLTRLNISIEERDTMTQDKLNLEMKLGMIRFFFTVAVVISAIALPIFVMILVFTHLIAKKTFLNKIVAKIENKCLKNFVLLCLKTVITITIGLAGYIILAPIVLVILKRNIEYLKNGE